MERKEQRRELRASWTRWYLMGHRGGEVTWVWEEVPQLSMGQGPGAVGPRTSC